MSHPREEWWPNNTYHFFVTLLVFMANTRKGNPCRKTSALWQHCASFLTCSSTIYSGSQIMGLLFVCSKCDALICHAVVTIISLVFPKTSLLSYFSTILLCKNHSIFVSLPLCFSSSSPFKDRMYKWL